MNHDASFPLGRSTIILVIVSLAAATLNLLFVHALHLESAGLLGFGLFCAGYGTVLASRFSRRRNKDERAVVTNRQGTPKGVHSVLARDKGLRELPEFSARPCHALTIDLEDYFHTEVAAQGVSFSDWEQQPSRIEASTHRLLELLEDNRTHATFFVLGWVAKRYPGLIREIHECGHEIGCHSLNHRLVCRMEPAEFYEATRAAKNLIEASIRESIQGYRAPCFSITPGHEWAFDVLADLGFTYDSSVHPVHHPTYGNPTAPRAAYSVAQGRLMEFPIATWKLAGRNLSVGGGAYLRLLPYQYIHRGLMAWEREMRTSAMLYLHPWEIDPYQPYIPLSFRSRIRQTWGTTTMEEKLRHLLRQFSFAPVREVHRNLLEGKEHQKIQSTFQHSREVEQVAG